MSYTALLTESDSKDYDHCPSCGRSRKTLAIFPNGSQHCHACGYHQSPNTMTITIPPTTPFEWASRKLTQLTLDKYFIGTSEINGHLKIVMPHLDTDGTPLGYTTRTPGERDFRTMGKPCPFGLHLLGNHDVLFICEGHTDTLSMAQVFPDADVIGLPGAATVGYLKGILSKLKRYREIYICPDPDEAGEVMREALLDMLPASKTKSVTLVTDVSDYLMSDDIEGLKLRVTLATANSKSPFVTKEDLVNYGETETLISTGLGALDSLLGGGLECRALTILTGESGKGKSSLAAQIALNASQSHKTLYIAGEMAPIEVLRMFVRMKLNRLPRVGEFNTVAEEILDRILVAKYVNDLDHIIDMIDQAVIDHGVELVILDVLSDVSQFDTDYKVAASVVSELAKHCKGADDRPGYALLAVGHTKGDVEGYVTLNDVRGGKAVVQKAAPIIGISEVPGQPYTRVLYPIKRPRNGGLNYTTEPVRIIYDKQNYKYYSEVHDDAEEKQGDIRFSTGGRVPQQAPKSDIPSADIPVSTSEAVRMVEEQQLPERHNPSEPVLEVHTGLLGSSEEHLHRDQGVRPCRIRGQDEDEGDASAVPRVTLDVSHSDEGDAGSECAASGTQCTDIAGHINVDTGLHPLQASRSVATAGATEDPYVQWARGRLVELGYDPEILNGGNLQHNPQ